MSAIANYASKYNRDMLNNFAAASYDQNSAKEILDALGGDADGTDVATWGLSGEDEWRDALWAAYMDRMEKENGGVDFEGTHYALTRQAELTNRLYYDGHINFNDVADGETYDEEWSALAVDAEGNEFEIYWIFENTKGEDGIDDPSNFSWDEIDRVVAL